MWFVRGVSLVTARSSFEIGCGAGRREGSRQPLPAAYRPPIYSGRMPAALFLAIALLGANLVLLAAVLLRVSGADARTGRRLRWAREHPVGSLLDMERLPERPIRVSGRIRCSDPLVDGDGNRLVAYHRDVEVRLPDGRWRSIERLRETRSFELWDHDGSLSVDPSRAAEPLVSIPRVWRGRGAELEAPHLAAAARLVPDPSTAEARSVTRTVNVTDRLLVLAAATRTEAGGLALEPAPGGFVISTLPVDDAMRLLGGRHRTLLRVAAVTLPAGLALLTGGLLLAGLALLVDR